MVAACARPAGRPVGHRQCRNRPVSDQLWLHICLCTLSGRIGWVRLPHVLEVPDSIPSQYTLINGSHILLYARDAHAGSTDPINLQCGGVPTSQLHVPSLTSFSVAGWGRLQLTKRYITSVALLQVGDN